MAAGFGTRMRSLTDTTPKALVEVGGVPLIDHMLERLAAVGVEKIVVNVHAFADQLEAHLRSHKGIVISDERGGLLETGGGLVKALPLLGDAPVLICNIDAIWLEFDDVLAGLVESWNPAVMDELFLLARKDAALGYSGAGDFNVTKKGQIVRPETGGADYIYAGVEIFKPALAESYKPEKFSRNKIWDNTIKRGKAYGHVLPGYWMHVGDPQALHAAEAVLGEAG